MHTLFSDCPEEIARLFPEAAPASNEGPLLEFCQRFGEGQTIETFESDLPMDLLVIGQAPGSQFTIFQDAMRTPDFFPDNFYAIALTGRNFRGQRKRSWAVQSGNIHLCASFAPELPISHLFPGLNIVPALAALDVIRDLGIPGIDCGVKWVNDVLLNGRKTAGIIAASQTSGSNIQKAVLGIGLNVAIAPEIEKAGLMSQPGCLADVCPDVSFSKTLCSLISHLNNRWAQLTREGSAPLFTEYHANSLAIGREVSIRKDTEGSAPGSELCRGTLLDILPNLDLVIEGVEQPVSSGRLQFRD